MDVTDFRPLLTGRHRIVQECGTYGEGWLVSVTFDFYPGPPADGRFATDVINLWSGSPKSATRPPGHRLLHAAHGQTPRRATAAKLRMAVTGHGMSPNTGNAAEFLALGRTLTVNDATYRNELWKATTI